MRRLILKADDQSRDGERMMSRIGLLCAAVALGIFSSPSTAQQTTPEQPLPPTQQTAPGVPPAPPPDAQTPETPPPFPPMPAAPPRHRWVDMSNHRAHAHRRAGHVHRGASHAGERAGHPTRKMMRWCRSMNRRQLTHHHACRTLMQHELHAAPGQHHQASHRHGAAHRRTGQRRTGTQRHLRQNRTKHRS